MNQSVPTATAVSVHVKENSPPREQIPMAIPRVEPTRAKVRGALFGGAETMKILPAAIRLSLIARAKQIRRDLGKLSKEEFESVIEAEKVYHPEHSSPEWQNAYATFLRGRMEFEQATLAPVEKPSAKRASREVAGAAKKKKSVRKAVPPPADDVDSLLAKLLGSPEGKQAAGSGALARLDAAPEDVNADLGLLTDLNDLHGYDFVAVDFEHELEQNALETIDTFFASSVGPA